MFVRFFKCVVKATIDNAPKALMGFFMPAVVNAVYDIAGDVIKNWKQQTPEADERRAEVQELAVASLTEVRRQAEQAVAAVAANQPEPVRRDLVTYLTQLPGTIRQSLRRIADPTGATVPAQLALDRPEDVLPFLPTQLPRFQPGARVGDCELVELLGVGGFGEVWKATNPHRPDPVALKFCTDATAAKVLRNEAKLLGRIVQHGRHPGIVALLESHLSHEPPYLEYEYVAGGDLGRVIRSWKRLDPAERLERSIRMMRKLAEIVAFAHRKDIVHRDLKPTNILLKPTETGNYALRVTDFGIGGTATDHAGLQTGAGTTRGALMPTLLRGAHTPLYASPQQIKGERPDPRDDVHALGVIWYQILTGDPSAAASADWREELSERLMPDEVLNLLGRCMAARAERRPENAEVVVEELLRLGTSPAGKEEERHLIPENEPGQEKETAREEQVLTFAESDKTRLQSLQQERDREERRRSKGQEVSRRREEKRLPDAAEAARPRQRKQVRDRLYEDSAYAGSLHYKEVDAADQEKVRSPALTKQNEKRSRDGERDTRRIIAGSAYSVFGIVLEVVPYVLPWTVPMASKIIAAILGAGVIGWGVFQFFKAIVPAQASRVKRSGHRAMALGWWQGVKALLSSVIGVILIVLSGVFWAIYGYCAGCVIAIPVLFFLLLLDAFFFRWRINPSTVIHVIACICAFVGGVIGLYRGWEETTK